MKVSYILKASFIVICCFIVFAFGVVIIPIGLGLLAIYVLALMFSEETEGKEND
jgi:hypothetical protein